MDDQGQPPTTQPGPVPTEAEGPRALVTIAHVSRTMRVYGVNDLRLEIITSANNPVSWSIFGISIGAAVAFFITVTTATLTPVMQGISVGLLVVSIVAAILSGIHAVLEGRKARRTIERIKRESA